MTTIKVKFRSPDRPDIPGTLFYCLTRKKRTRQWPTGYRLFPAEWHAIADFDFLSDSPSLPVLPTTERHPVPTSVREAVRNDLLRIKDIISFLESSVPDYSPDQLTEQIKKHRNEHTLRTFTERLIREMEKKRQFKTAQSYRYTLHSFLKFMGNDFSWLSDITAGSIAEYECWLQCRGVGSNTVSYYMRTLRSIYNKAAEQNLIPQQFPFKRVYTGIAKTRKRAVDKSAIVRLKKLPLIPGSTLAFARDLFLFSLYARGMAFIDIAHLRRRNLQGDVLHYFRHKTGQPLYVKLEPCMLEIIDRYVVSETPGQYLFPILKSTEPPQVFLEYRNALTTYNRLLKHLSKRAALDIPLSSYVARHTWATLAHKNAVPIPVISEGLGHYSEKTTRIYLSSLDQSMIDKANASLLNTL